MAVSKPHCSDEKPSSLLTELINGLSIPICFWVSIIFQINMLPASYTPLVFTFTVTLQIIGDNSSYFCSSWLKVDFLV